MDQQYTDPINSMKDIVKTLSFPLVGVMLILKYCLFCDKVLRYGEWSDLRKLRKSSFNLYYKWSQEHPLLQ